MDLSLSSILATEKHVHRLWFERLEERVSVGETKGLLIVDGANWSRHLEGEKLKIDYNRVVSRVQQATGVKIVVLSYYTTYRSMDGFERRRGFIEYLKRLGWDVRAMPATLGIDGRWRDKEVDVAIALDAYEEVRSGSVNAVLIGSGDADFAALFRRLPDQIQKWSIGFRASVSPTLRQVSKVVLVEDLGVLREAPQVIESTQPESLDEPLTEKERKMRQARARN